MLRAGDVTKTKLKVTNVIPLKPIASSDSPREILAADYGNMGGILPIKGGWGYTKEDACIIDKNDPVADKNMPFNGVAIEYSFIERRIWEEMIVFRRKDERFAGIKWILLNQELVHGNGRFYDMLEFEITALPRQVWEALKSEWEGPNGYGSDGFDEDEHEIRRARSQVTITREFWFDITSFFGKQG